MAEIAADERALPLELALSAVLTASLDGAALPLLLAAVARVPAQRGPVDAAPREATGPEGQDRRS